MKTMKNETVPEVALKKTGFVKTNRKPRKAGAKKEARYFDEKTQASIVAFQNATTSKEKHAIYRNEIMPAFEKLVENLIHIYKFTSLYDTFDDLKLDCIHFLYETLEKFKAEKGTKAFSYFNIVARNWLSVKSKKKAASLKKTFSMNNVEGMSKNDKSLLDDKIVIHEKNARNSHSPNLKIESILTILHEIKTKVKTDNEINCINSIFLIFENINSIDLLNKTAVLVYMRELSGLTSKQLTLAMSSIKKHYKKLKQDPEILDLFS
jgi:hypothetical protein